VAATIPALLVRSSRPVIALDLGAILKREARAECRICPPLRQECNVYSERAVGYAPQRGAMSKL